MTVDIARRAGLGELVRRSAARTPDSIAVVFGDRTWTYAQLLEAAEACRGARWSRVVRRGIVSRCSGRNSDTYLITWLATQLAGAIHVPVNFMLNAREVAYIVEHSGARAGAGRRGAVRRACPSATRAADARPTSRRAGTSRARSPSAGIAAIDVAQIIYTSGTESPPKGAMLTHSAVLWQYQSCVIDGEMGRADGRAPRAAAVPLRPARRDDRAGPAGRLPQRDHRARRRPDNLIPLLARHGSPRSSRRRRCGSRCCARRCSTSTTCRALAQGLLRRLDHARRGAARDPRAPARLRLWNCTARPRSHRSRRCCSRRSRCAAVLVRPAGAARRRPGWSTTTCSDIAPGEVGEVVHRSPHLMTGYWNDPEQTAAAFEGGWFHSGDLATIDGKATSPSSTARRT